MSDLADLVNAVVGLLWLGVGVAALWLLRSVLRRNTGALSKLGVGPGGVTLEFAEAKISEAISTSDPATRRTIGNASTRSVAARMQRNADLLAGAKVLWVDDHPEYNTPILELLRRFGCTVETPRTNQEALGLLEGTRFHVILSDVARDHEGPSSELKGVDFARQVHAEYGQQVLLFTARFNPATLPGRSDSERLRLVEELRETTFAVTNRMDAALHYVLDILERER